MCSRCVSRLTTCPLLCLCRAHLERGLFCFQEEVELLPELPKKPSLVGVGWHQQPLAPLGQGVQLMPLFSLAFLCHKLGQGRCCHLKIAFWGVKEKIIEGGGGRGGVEAAGGRQAVAGGA